MNGKESKYFNTAVRMDEALLEILETKDLPYITVSELCRKAGVNRSTFYLHYENVQDVLSECLDNTMAELRRYYPEEHVQNSTLRLVTADYVLPYLKFIKGHKRLFCSIVKDDLPLKLQDYYQELFRSIFSPLMESYHIPEWKKRYISAFYINGFVAIILEWLKGGMKEPEEDICELIMDFRATVSIAL